MISPKLLLRISAACLLFFAAGHSLGHFDRHNVSDPKAREVLKVMKENRFDMFGQMRTYDESYEGMSLNLIFTLVALAIILWLLSNYTKNQPSFVKQLLIPIALCVMGFGITSWLFFFPAPAITCFIAALLMFFSVLRLR